MSTATGQARLVRPVGELTIGGAADLRDELAAALEAADEVGGIDLDLDAVDDIDTSGLQLLLMLRAEAAARDVPLRVVGVSERVRTVLGVLGLGDDLAPQAPEGEWA